ncbi:uncharacterized protein BO95DRAFT_431598 [Aspergillus brunneoviolaceus CBS 621.78]|uniref:Uncharacterized protein n=1 Tax=Aspergillus brunneoviolaceus CBS 621.78 TaxID=1450534 RepID=A0ACD1GA57_9EURO|nr:hypothetical protein BO95DRAFT_431598 [Aspergillus brunneoviolaceus CBS 621.78]RAH46053.1 hypothetical protein BO95DRAFT_431598 [Aspergillus brunneoviolaceus CBS 621.78]
MSSPSTISNTSTHPSSIPEPLHKSITRGLLSITEGEELLSKFRTELMPLFPFVIVPEASFVELGKQSPFLLLCIITACLEHRPDLQQKLELEARAVISTRIVMNMERDMDLLRGLLVHIAWYHYHWRVYHTQVYMLLQMAMAIVVDFGLDRCDNFRMQRHYPEEKEAEEPHKAQALYLTPDGQRAFLECYYLCSNLGQRAEYPTDQSLKALIEIQSLARRSEPEVEDPIHAMSTDELSRSMDILENRIEHRLVQKIQCNTWALRLELNAMPAIVLGHALRQQKDDPRQYEKQQLLTIARSAFNTVTVFLASPASITPNLPMFSYTSIWYGLLVLSKLSLLSDAATKGKAVDVRPKDIHNLGLAAMQKMATMSRNDDVWDKCRAVIGSMLSWLESSRARPHSTPDRGDTRTPFTQHAENAHISPQPTPDDPPRAPGFAAAVAEDWDATVWQQMLHDLTWIGLPVEQPFAVDLAYLP